MAELKPIPPNPNSIENGMVDPTPEQGTQGSSWRALVSWVKGWFVRTPPRKEP